MPESFKCVLLERKHSKRKLESIGSDPSIAVVVIDVDPVICIETV